MERFPRAQVRQEASALAPRAAGVSRISCKSLASPQSKGSLLSQAEAVKSLCCRTLGLSPCTGDQFSKLGGRDRHLREADIKRRQGVLNRGYDRGGGGNDADFADALDAERIVRRRRF